MSAATTPAIAAVSATLAPPQVHRPKEGQCVRCVQRTSCTLTDFSAMPVRLVHADGTRIVNCLEFQSRRGKMN